MTEKVLIALIAASSAIIGGVIGGLMPLIGQRMQEERAAKREREKDEPRRELLRAMLNDRTYEWRTLDTLSHVIGADAETTKRLLLEVGARASEDRQDKWSLIKRNPLPDNRP